MTNEFIHLPQTGRASHTLPESPLLAALQKPLPFSLGPREIYGKDPKALVGEVSGGIPTTSWKQRRKSAPPRRRLGISPGEPDTRTAQLFFLICFVFREMVGLSVPAGIKHPHLFQLWVAEGVGFHPEMWPMDPCLGIPRLGRHDSGGGDRLSGICGCPAVPKLLIHTPLLQRGRSFHPSPTFK